MLSQKESMPAPGHQQALPAHLQADGTSLPDSARAHHRKRSITADEAPTLLHKMELHVGQASTSLLAKPATEQCLRSGRANREALICQLLATLQRLVANSDSKGTLRSPSLQNAVDQVLKSPRQLGMALQLQLGNRKHQQDRSLSTIRNTIPIQINCQ